MFIWDWVFESVVHWQYILFGTVLASLTYFSFQWVDKNETKVFKNRARLFKNRQFTERVDVMGFWYLLLLLIGIILFIIGIMKKGVSVAVKTVILLFVIGILFIVVSIVLLMPGSSDIIAQLLKWE